MHSNVILLNRLLWATSGFLCVGVFLVGLWTKRVRTFPLFFALAASYPIEFLIFFMVQNVRSYAIWSWSTAFLMGAIFLLELAVLYQLADIVIFSHATLARHLKSVRRWTVVLLVLSTTMLAAMGNDVSQDAGTSAFARLSLFQDFFETGLLICLVAIRRTFALQYKALPVGVAIGWGVAAFLNLLADALVRATTVSMLWGNVVRATGFNACVLVWLWYTARQPSPELPPAERCRAIDLHRQIIDTERTLRSLADPKRGE